MILLVENDRHQRMLYRMELEEEGYRAVETADLSEAIDILKRSRPDLMVFDPPRQKEDGVRFLREARRLHPTLPVVLHTGYSPYGDDFYSGLVDAFVLKSSNLQRLKQTLVNVFKQENGTSEPGEKVRFKGDAKVDNNPLREGSRCTNPYACGYF